MPRSTSTSTSRDPLERELAAVRAAAADPRAVASRAALSKVLASRRGFAVAAAAKVVGEASLVELAEELPPAFERLVERGTEVDPSCRGKTAVASALHQLEWDDPDFFLARITFVQRDPVWGGSVDTAAELRGACALGLAALHDERAVAAISGLLVDPEWVARLHAARALGGAGRVEAEGVLRLKALVGDPEPQVQSEVLLALLSSAPRAGFDFVVSLLQGEVGAAPGSSSLQHAVTAGEPMPGLRCTCCGAPPRLVGGDRVESAALAIGQSRHERAFEVLRRFSEHGARESRERQRVALVAIAMVRSPEAINHLIELITRGSLDDAAESIAALGMHRYDLELRRRVGEAATARGGARIERAFREAFPTG